MTMTWLLFSGYLQLYGEKGEKEAPVITDFYKRLLLEQKRNSDSPERPGIFASAFRNAVLCQICGVYA